MVESLVLRMVKVALLVLYYLIVLLIDLGIYSLKPAPISCEAGVGRDANKHVLEHIINIFSILSAKGSIEPHSVKNV